MNPLLGPGQPSTCASSFSAIVDFNHASVAIAGWPVIICFYTEVEVQRKLLGRF